jgi:Ca2+-transporting ATPase
VTLRLERFGPNRVRLPERARVLPIVLHQFKSPLIYNCRSNRRSAFALSPFSNRFLFFGVGASLLLHIGAMYFEPTQRLIRLQPLALETWMRIVGVALSIVLAVELHKLLRRSSGSEASPPVETS